MTLTVTPIGDNPQVPGVTGYSYIPDQLIAGNLKLVTSPVVVSGTGVLPRGTVLGQKTTQSVEVTPGATNTGNGTVGSTGVGASVKYGTYTLTATAPTIFSVTDPEGTVLGNATAGTAFSTGNEVLFTITAGSTAFAAGDSFSLYVPQSTGDYVVSVKTASDGSQTPSAILATSVDTTNGPVTVDAYVMGEFNARAISYDSSWTLPALQAALRSFSIFVKFTVSAADPS